MARKHLLVTGGAGFIGSWFIRYLLEHLPDVRITNLDLLTYAGNPDNLTDIEDMPNYRFVQGDIGNVNLVNQLMRDVDVCINIAAQTHVDRSITDPALFVRTNVLGTQVLLEAARTCRIEKFIQVSTDEVYGSLPLDAADQRFTETAPLNPSSPYAASKTAADLLALSYYKTYHLPVCVTRCSNNYGPRQYPEKLIPLFILNAAQDKPVPVYGDGCNVRDWIHVADHSQALAAVMEKGRPGEIYNIGADQEKSNLDMTRSILKHLDKPADLIRFVTDRPGHDRRYALDSSKIRHELGWRPTCDFEQGLAETIQWYLENPVWVAGIHQREQNVLTVVSS